MREKELQWLRDHPAELESLQGKWIAVEGDNLIAEGDAFERFDSAVEDGEVFDFEEVAVFAQAVSSRRDFFSLALKVPTTKIRFVLKPPPPPSRPR